MSVTLNDVRHIALLARLGLSAERAMAATAELNTILAHMEVLSRVDTEDTQNPLPATAAAMPLRLDRGPPIPLGASVASFAPETRDGLLLVPRLSTHEDPEATS